MKNLNETYNQIIKEIRYRNENELKTLSDPLSELVIFEDCAFHKLPRAFADFLIGKIKNLKNNYDKSKQFIEEIDLRSAFKLIKEDEIHNVKDFYNFLQILSNSTNEKILRIQISNECSYTEPISLREFKTEEYKKFNHSKNNAKYSYELAKRIEHASYNYSLKIMKEYVNEIEDLGTLQFDINEIDNENFVFDNDDTILGHEIRHFIIFLQRWSKTNYEICMKYSNQNLDKIEHDFNAYQLNENEFITLSSTYIERLINIFEKFKRDDSINEINLLIKSILFLANNSYKDISDRYWLNILNELINIDSDDPIKIITKLKVKRIVDFYKNILDDSKYNIKNNKFKTLIGWTTKSFNERRTK